MSSPSDEREASAAAFAPSSAIGKESGIKDSCQKPKSQDEWTSSTLSDARDIKEKEFITSLSVGDGRYLVDLGSLFPDALSSSEFIVDEECLLQLFSSCRRCHRRCTVGRRVTGLKLVVNQTCGFCEYRSEWTNLPDGDDGGDDDNDDSAKL